MTEGNSDPYEETQLGELLRNCRPSRLHSETDFGADVGREVIISNLELVEVKARTEALLITPNT